MHIKRVQPQDNPAIQKFTFGIQMVTNLIHFRPYMPRKGTSSSMLIRHIWHLMEVLIYKYSLVSII